VILVSPCLWKHGPERAGAKATHNGEPALRPAPRSAPVSLMPLLVPRATLWSAREGPRRNGLLPLRSTLTSRVVASYTVPRDSVPLPVQWWDQAAVGCLVRPCAWLRSTRRAGFPCSHPPVSVGALLCLPPGSEQHLRAVRLVEPLQVRGADLLPPTQLPQFYQVKRSVLRVTVRIQILVHYEPQTN
jgi:hypothetical protein